MENEWSLKNRASSSIQHHLKCFSFIHTIMDSTVPLGFNACDSLRLPTSHLSFRSRTNRYEAFHHSCCSAAASKKKKV